MWIISLIRELIKWRVIYKWVSKKENEKLVNDYNLKVDWIGRMYTFINFPEPNPPLDVVEHRMRIEMAEKFNKMQVKLNIANLVYYNYKQVSPTQYIFFLTPDKALIDKNLGILSLILGSIGTIFGFLLGITLLYFSLPIAFLLVYLLGYSFVLL